MGGDSRLISLDMKEATALADEGASLHLQWVRAEPFFTQAAARAGFLGATSNAQNSASMGKLLLQGGHRQRRIRPTVHFRRRFCLDEDDSTACGDQVD
jgi:hypothetical protein